MTGIAYAGIASPGAKQLKGHAQVPAAVPRDGGHINNPRNTIAGTVTVGGAPRWSIS